MSTTPNSLGQALSRDTASSWWRERSSLATLGVGSALAAATTYLLLSKHQPVSDYALCLALLSLWVFALPLWVFLVQARRSLLFPVFVSALHAVYFALPVFSTRPLFGDIKTGSAWDSVDRALELVLCGAIALMIGMFGTRRLVTRAPRIRRDIDLPRALLPLAAMAAVSFAVRVAMAGSTARTFGSIIFAVNGVGQIALGGLLLGWLRGQLHFGYKLYTCALVGILLATGLVTGALANVAMPLVALAFLYGWERRRIPWAGIFAAVLALAPLNASKQQFRVAHGSSSSEKLSPSNIATFFASFLSITADAIENGQLGSEDVVDADQARTNLLGMMTVVVNETPRTVPYWDGHTYSDLAWHLIPRILVPDKPAPEMGQDFPRRYGLVDYWDYDTMVNVSQFTELYINFGPVGIVFGMLFIGLIYALLEQMFTASSGGAIIGAVVFSGLMNVESSFSPSFGGLPLIILSYYAIVRVLPTQRLSGSDTLLPDPLPHDLAREAKGHNVHQTASARPDQELPGLS